MGTFGDQPNGGQADTVAQTAAAYTAAMAATAAQQVDAGRYIREYGAAVLDGHAPVGMSEVDSRGSDPDTGGMDAAD